MQPVLKVFSPPVGVSSLHLKKAQNFGGAKLLPVLLDAHVYPLAAE